MCAFNPEIRYKIETPYCRKSEYRWWLFLTDKLVAMNISNPIAVVRTHICTSANPYITTEALLVEKSGLGSRYGYNTALVTKGDYAGYLADRFKGYVRVGRPVTVDGAEFDIRKAKQHLHKLELAPDYNTAINKLLPDTDIDPNWSGFPDLLLLLLGLNQVEVDGERFLSNIIISNLHGKLMEINP